jgi:hypothetical protein
MTRSISLKNNFILKFKCPKTEKLNLLDISSSRRRIGHGQFDLLIRANNVKGSNCHGSGWVISSVLIQHVEGNCQGALFITDDWVWKVPLDVEAV